MLLLLWAAGIVLLPYVDVAAYCARGHLATFAADEGGLLKFSLSRPPTGWLEREVVGRISHVTLTSVVVSVNVENDQGGVDRIDVTVPCRTINFVVPA